MERPLSAVDLHYLVAEFQCLLDGKVEKVYQWDRDFIFRLFCGSKKHLRLDPSGIVHLTKKKYKGPKFPVGYCTFLRKYLQGARIRKVYQEGFERVLVIVFESRVYGELYLIAELFGQGNLVLCKEEEGKLVVIHPLERQKLKDRSVESKKEYIFPPARLNVKKASDEEFFELMESDKDIGRFIASDLGLGGTYSEELVTRLSLDKSKPIKELNVKKELINAVRTLLEEELSPFTLKENAYPIALKSINRGKDYDSFNDALDSFFEGYSGDLVKESKPSEKKDKLQTMIETQEKRIKQLERESEENQRIAEFIYEKYADFQKLLDALDKVRKKEGWKRVEEKVKELENYRSYDKKNKKLTLEFK